MWSHATESILTHRAHPAPDQMRAAVAKLAEKPLLALTM
jgi:hypothetical protein